jgi:ELWxxDGT repeat protein
MFSFSGVTIGNKIIFAANDGSLGSEVWMTDGTAAETKLMLDIRPGTVGSNPAAFTAFKNEIYFTADDGIQGPALWKSDGTPSGTVTIKSFSPPGNPLLSNLTVVGDMIMFSAYDVNGWALWRSDGTAAGTTLVKDIHPGKDNRFTIGYFSYVNELLYFMANDGTHGNELWISNGTPTGTYLVDLEPGLTDSNPKYFIAVTDDVVYFSAAGKLWKSDGTASHTTVAADVEPMGNLIYKDGWIYFIGFSRDYGMELFKVEHEDFITAIVPENDIAISLSPNPATNTIQLASSLNEDVMVSILDLRGAVLSSFLLEANTTKTHSVSEFSNGIYIARFDISRGVTVKKFIKK